jgi:putative ABC transport system ATP-binding protein
MRFAFAADRRRPSDGSGRTGARVVVEAVSRVFAGPITALADVSLTVEPGEFVALTGPSGSGKTTLLSLVGAIDRPTTGRVTIDGTTVTSQEDAARHHRDVIGFVFQHHYLLPHLPARANVELPLIGAGVGRAERRARADALLDEVGLSHRTDSIAAHLSGGERQRVAIARALANDPRLLLADEPTGALDTGSTERVIGLLEEAREKRGMSMLVVTYDPALAARADRIVHLRDGRIVPGELEPLRPSTQQLRR